MSSASLNLDYGKGKAKWFRISGAIIHNDLAGLISFDAQRHYSSGNIWARRALRFSDAVGCGLPGFPQFSTASFRIIHDGSRRSISNETLVNDKINQEVTTQLGKKSSSFHAIKNRKGVIRKRLRERRKTRKQVAVMDSASKLEIIERTQNEWENFFDQVIGPQAMLTRIKELTTRLEGMVAKYREETESEQIDEGEKKPTKNADTRKTDDDPFFLPLKTVFLNMLYSTGPSNRIQVQVLEYLLSTNLPVRPKKKSLTAAPSESDEQNPEMNVSINDKYVEIIQTARDHLVRTNCYWNKFHKETSLSLSLDESSAEMQDKIKLHTSKSEEMLREESEELLSSLRQSLPSLYVKALMALFKSYGKSGNSRENDHDALNNSDEPMIVDDLKTKNTESTPFPRGFLAGNLKKIIGTHLHLVAEELADFFYICSGRIDISISDDAASQSDSFVVTDRSVVLSQRKWESARKQFAETMASVQGVILESHVSTNENEVDPYESVDKIHVEEECPEVAESDIASNIATSASKKKTAKSVARDKRKFHAKFEATVLFEETSAGLESLKNMVFIDNLPIDITELDIKELYSRCGKVNAISIYNQRLDLDPGPLGKVELAKRRKERFGRIVSSRRQWQRPRTPVYALLSFGDEESCDRSLIDSLRIFGMLVRKHDVRSIRPDNMKSLYLYDIPAEINGRELEKRLLEQFAPNITVGISVGQNAMQIARSCEIIFPSFEVAFQARRKLADWDFLSTCADGDKPRCSIHWFRSTTDEELWWTRKIGFE